MGTIASHSPHILSNNVHNFIPAQVGILGLQPQIAAIGPKPRNTTINHDGGTMFDAGGDDRGHYFDPGGPFFISEGSEKCVIFDLFPFC